MGKHRLARRLGAKMAIPVALLTVSTAVLVSSLNAAAALDISVVGGDPTCNTQTGVATIVWTINANDPQVGTFTDVVTDPVVAEGWLTSTIENTPTAQGVQVTMILPTEYNTTSSITLTVTANYPNDPDGDFDATGSDTVPLTACLIAPSPSPSPTPSPTRAPTTPRTTTPAPSVVPSTSATPLPTISTSQVAVAGTSASYTNQGNGGRAAPSTGGSGPSLIMVGSTAGILLAFLIALIFLVRERRLLRREAEDEEDEDYGYWNNYRTDFR